VDLITAALSDLGVKQAVRKALHYERAYGGSAIYVGAVDGAMDAAQPLQVGSIRAIRHLTVFERRQLIAVQYQEDPLAPDYGKPWLYQVQSFSGVGTGQKRACLAARDLPRPPSDRPKPHGGTTGGVTQCCPWYGTCCGSSINLGSESATP
jgi:hypothetical protein